MNEDLKVELQQYEVQLEQVKLALSATTDDEERENLTSLLSDINELITLTKENLSKSEAKVQSKEDNDDPLSAEYALFKAELADIESKDEEEKQTVVDLENDLKELEGLKCQAPYKETWETQSSYHNALVFHVEDISSVTNSDELQVRVMYTHPTNKAMLPCPYYLEGNCKFPEDRCKFSHGQLVLLNELREYREPKFTNLTSGSRVLAKNSDQLWYRACIVSTDGDYYRLKLESSQQEIENHLKDIYPLDNKDEISDEDSSDDDSDTNIVDEEILETARRVLSAPASSVLGEWQQYTTGFGSKIMAKMGYVTGSGLGVRNDGRIEPVPAVILPAGKSLDHCMKLRENAGGDENLFKAERKMKRQQMKHERALSRAYEKEQQRSDVFTFLNNKIGQGVLPGPSSSTSKDKPNNLKTETSRGLNVTSLQLSEQVKRTEKEIKSLRQSLNRQAVDSPAYTQIKEKLDSKESVLNQLHQSERKVSAEQELRKDRRKLVVF